MDSLSFKVDGLCCAEECALLKRELGPLVGGDQNLAFDVLERKLTVIAPPPGLTAQAVQQSVARTGMRAIPLGNLPAGTVSVCSGQGRIQVRRISLLELAQRRGQFPVV